MAKTALVTGGSKRLGAAIVCCLHRRGYNICLHYRNSKKEAAALADKLQQIRADSVQIMRADLSQHSQLVQLAADAVAAWGEVDVLVNNAADFCPQAVEEVSVHRWQQVLASNLQAPFFLAQQLLGTLKATNGCILNLIDIHAERGLAGYPVYSIAKGGLATMTRVLAKELAPDIRVNGVAPGAILWPDSGACEAQQQAIIEKIALKKIGDVADIAKAVAFLAQDAPYITGQIITVDGGRSLFD